MKVPNLSKSLFSKSYQKVKRKKGFKSQHIFYKKIVPYIIIHTNNIILVY